MKKTILRTNQNDPQIRAYKEAVERGRHNYHIVPAGDDWVLRKADAHNSRNTFGTQSEAIRAGREIARNQQSGELIIHGRNGRITARESYASDPFPPKDTNH